MSGKHRVNDVAMTLGVSQTTIYKAFGRMKDKLNGHFCKEKGILIFDDEALQVFRSAISTADQTSVPVVPVTAILQPQVDLVPVVSRLDSMEKALLLMADELRAVRQENAGLRAMLTPPPATEKPAERSFSDELATAVAEIKGFITGSLSPFTTWLKWG